MKAVTLNECRKKTRSEEGVVNPSKTRKLIVRKENMDR
jgi:hypothetical protein